MTKYLEGRFTVMPGINKAYGENYDRIFGKKESKTDAHDCDDPDCQRCNHLAALPEQEPELKLVALNANCGDCDVAGPTFFYKQHPYGICADCAAKRRNQ